MCGNAAEPDRAGVRALEAVDRAPALAARGGRLRAARCSVRASCDVRRLQTGAMLIGPVRADLDQRAPAPAPERRVRRLGARTTIARAGGPGDAVETAGIEPASAIAPKVVSTSVAGTLGLASGSPCRPGSSRPAS